MAKVSHSNPNLDDCLEGDDNLPDGPEATHTPGPWAVEDSKSMPGDINILLGDYQKFYVPLWAIDLTYQDKLIRRANASLIAAAPDLLEALKEYNRELPSGLISEKSIAAIAKARGQS